MAAPALKPAAGAASVIAAGASATADFGRRRTRRRVWSRAGRAHIEVRGLTGHGDAHRRLSRAVTAALRGMRGVRWAEVNAVTAQVFIDFDQSQVDVADLIETIQSVERRHGSDTDTFDWSSPPHPADDAPLYAAGAALAADLAGMAAAASSRLAPLLRLPAAIRVPIVVVEGQPRLRQEILRRLGPTGGELLLTVGNAIAHGLSGGASPLAADAVGRLLQIGELASRREVWALRERELHGSHPLPAEHRPVRARPVPLPPGPVENVSNWASLAALGGAAGALAWTRDPGQAADLLLATGAKAARLGREGFAAMLGSQLARRGVVPLDGAALRRMDRVSAIVIDSASLCAPRARLLSAEAEPSAQSWQAAERVLAAQHFPDLAGSGPWQADGWRLSRARGDAGGGIDGPAGLLLDLRDSRGRRCGRFLAGCELDLHAEALLGAARDGAERVLLTGHASTAELVVWADEVVSAPPEGLEPLIRSLQLRGEVVLAVSADDSRGLDAADVGLSVCATSRPVCWTADLVCGPGLANAWRVLRSAAAARRASERTARLAVGGAALGALLVTAGNGPRRTRLGVAPTQSAAVVAMLSGASAARTAARAAVPPAVPRGDWHAMSPSDVLGRVRASQPAPAAAGQPGPPPRLARPLTAAFRPVRAAAESAITAAAGNAVVTRVVIPPARGATEFARSVRNELSDPLTPVLALGTMASAVVGSGIDSVLVAGVMGGNALISGAQRMRAERALRRMLLGEEISARRVRWPRVRDGELALTREPCFADLDSAPQEKTPARDLAPGDIIALEAADVVPADARLLAADGLEVDESPLTGESMPVTKDTGPVPGAPLAERTCMVYEGSTVLAGRAHAVVTATGGATEAGRAALAAGRGAPPTGIQARLAELTKISVPASGVGGLAVTGLGLLRGVPLRQAIASGVAVAVAAVPEGLPLVATVAQLAAARRLTGSRVLARSSRALEALGRVDVLCFDKTGTLTQGRLSVAKLAAPGGAIPSTSAHARRLLQTAARACPPVNGDRTRALPHATDRAVVESARRRAGADRGWQLAEELPFEATRGYSASLGRVGGKTLLAVKGAPEVVLPRCARVARPGDGGRAEEPATVPMTAQRRRAAEAVLHKLAAEGLRMLAVAEADLPGPSAAYHLALGGNGGAPAGNGRRQGAPSSRPARESGRGSPNETQAGRGADGPDEIVRDLTLTGFVAIADTVRPSARTAVRRLSEAGVRVIMITGDHPDTAAAIAAQVGIPDAERVLTGDELASLPEAARAGRIGASTVFARVSPEQKVRIVESLQRSGHVVAMVGDGVNDAAAIRLADVGIGVRASGSTSARSAADLILADSDPVRILDALAEGRALWARVRDAVSILVGGNAGEVAFMLLGTAATGRAPLSTRQLLLVNMLTDMLPALAVAVASAGPHRDGEDPLISGGPVGAFLAPELGRALAIRGGATALGASVAWQAGRMTGRRQRASTMGLATLVLTQLGQTLLTGSGRSPLTMATSAVSAAALAAIVETPGVSQFFGCTPLGPVGWGIVGVSAGGATLAAGLAPRLLPPPPTERAAAPRAGTGAGGGQGSPGPGAARGMMAGPPQAARHGNGAQHDRNPQRRPPPGRGRSGSRPPARRRASGRGPAR